MKLRFGFLRGKGRKKALLMGLYIFLALLAFLSGHLVPYAKQAIYGGAALPEAAAGGGTAAVTLKKGDYMLLGRYLDEPILWRVISVENGSTLLFSEYALCFKAFTAGEDPLEGSSNWQRSTLRQWLNSTEAAVEWAGVPPTPAHVYENHNAYAGEPGFLSAGNFTPRERALISQNGDMVFLLTKKQLQTIPAAQRRKSFTQAALRHDDSPYISARTYGWYWTADPIATNTQSVCAVTGRGTFYKSLATDGMALVCPALTLQSNRLPAAAGGGSKTAPYRISRGGAP